MVLGSILHHAKLNPACHKLHLLIYLQIPNTFHVSLLKPLIFNRYSDKSPSYVNGHVSVFGFKQLANVKCSTGKLFYLINWIGFGPQNLNGSRGVLTDGLLSRRDSLYVVAAATLSPALRSVLPLSIVLFGHPATAVIGLTSAFSACAHWSLVI